MYKSRTYLGRGTKTIRESDKDTIDPLHSTSVQSRRLAPLIVDAQLVTKHLSGTQRNNQ
jgi:hypothetical protein